MKNYRNLILYYSKDQKKKKDLFLQNYKKYSKELKVRNVKIQKKVNKNRSQLFNISLYGYDKKLKYRSNKINCIPIILKKIDQMPMGKLEEKVRKLKSIELYTIIQKKLFNFLLCKILINLLKNK